MNPELVVLSLLSGLFAAFSPCSLPAYPILLNMMSRGGEDRRILVAAFAAGFIGMFMLFYTILAAAIRWIGSNAAAEKLTLVYTAADVLAAVICILFALQSLGRVNVWGRTYGMRADAKPGVAGAFITGMLFSTVVTPCNLPFLVIGVYPLLLAKATAAEGLALMLLFGVSMSLPMLALGFASDYALKRHVKPHMKTIERGSAAFLLVAAAYFLYLAAQTLSAT